MTRPVADASAAAIRVGQVDNLRRIGNPPGLNPEFTYGPIANRPQVTNLPHKISM